ncbi:MAG TPA: T9SS type A sorting domain-containing protein [bacterium]|nr:T9SS type A sorting domain-containing protein [bacterium]HPN44647.1 T9SS type A sorting domain-containing protein [bacterium]
MNFKELSNVLQLLRILLLLCVFMLPDSVNSQVVQYDYGDAPDSPYPTLLARNGARHTVDGKVFLGALADKEANGQPNNAATGDDNAGSADEDGVTFTSSLYPGNTATVKVTVSTPGRLNAWIDFNKDGDWADKGEQIFDDRSVYNVADLTFNVPADAYIGDTYSRFRFSIGGGLSYTGLASNGEVEDYKVEIQKETPETTWDFGDAPAPYPTLLADNGARHGVDAGYRLGEKIDSDNEGMPDDDALGDDNDGNDDDDGVIFQGSLVAGSVGTALATVSAAGFLRGWIDFNRDGDWDDEGEALPAYQATPGTNPYPLIIPDTAEPGITFARFRYSNVMFEDYDGEIAIGEVEDYAVEVYERAPLPYEYGDAPEGVMAYPDLGIIGQFPTLRSAGPAGYIRHGSAGEMFLGYEIDYETDGNEGDAAPDDDPWDTDEGLNDRRADVVIYTDVGMTDPVIYTIIGDEGAERYWPNSITKTRGVLGEPGEPVEWGDDKLDMVYHVIAEKGAYLNVLIDWNQDGEWGGHYRWIDGFNENFTPEHIIQNFYIPQGFGETGFGRVSDLYPDQFVLPDDISGYVWTRWTLTPEMIDPGWEGSGNFSDGETEDYLLAVSFNGFYEFGDAPQQALAYPPSTLGYFGTDNRLDPGGAILHDPEGLRYFGDCVDYEWAGNAGLAFITPWEYNADEYYNNEFVMSGFRDTGLRKLMPYTIIGNPGSETISPAYAEGEEGELNRSLGSAGQMAVWGENIDFYINILPDAGDTYFNAVFDWDQDGHWHTSEYTIQNYLIPAGEAPFHNYISELGLPDFEIGSQPGYVWARFSLTDVPTPEPWVGHGDYPDGESEDYLLRVSNFSFMYDFGDLPCRSLGSLHGTFSALHTVRADFFLGDTVDTDPDGQPGPGGFGDDYDGADDDDGVTFITPLVPGQQARILVKAFTAGILSGWIDFDGDSTWDEQGEQPVDNSHLVKGLNEILFTVPTSAKPGVTFARFRFSDVPDLSPMDKNHFTDLPDENHRPVVGEVEDYTVLIAAVDVQYDFGDNPDPAYPTLLARSGAYHVINSGMRLGNLVDAENDGQPNSTATGDDAHNSDDDDGVKFNSSLQPGIPATVTITASAAGFINAWIDFNNDGDWLDRMEQIFLDQPVTSGSNVLTFTVPDSGLTGEQVYARFRYNSAGSLFFAGPAADGEVEDYLVPVNNTAVEEKEVGKVVPATFNLYANYPNPFNPETTIRFDVKNPCLVKLEIVDLLGRQVAILAQRHYTAGQYQVTFNAASLPSGIYFYSITMGDFHAVRKMALIR